MSNYNYNEVMYPTKFVICGIEMKPFSLGHYLLLERLKNPFLNDDPNLEVNFDEGITQFYICLIICGNTYEDANELLIDTKLFKKELNVFYKALKRNMKIDKDWNIFSKIHIFKQYIKYFTEMPIFEKTNKGDDKPSGVDWKQNLFTIAKGEFGYKDHEILNMPLRRLFYEWCSYAEKQGGIRVLTDVECKQIEMLNNQQI